MILKCSVKSSGWDGLTHVLIELWVVCIWSFSRAIWNTQTLVEDPEGLDIQLCHHLFLSWSGSEMNLMRLLVFNSWPSRGHLVGVCVCLWVLVCETTAIKTCLSCRSTLGFVWWHPPPPLYLCAALCRRALRSIHSFIHKYPLLFSTRQNTKQARTWFLCWSKEGFSLLQATFFYFISHVWVTYLYSMQT